MAAKPRKLHFFGITGHAMRGLALAARNLGYEVTGTDPSGKPPGSTWLDEHGITWWPTADPAHLAGVDLVVMSGGTSIDDVELLAAQEHHIPIVSFAEFVGELIEEKHRIVVAGTHGKTTTTSLITWLLESGRKHPDYLIGIQPRNFDSSVRLENATLAVLEGDEYKASSLDERSKFHFYRPDVLVVTSLEMDHPDLFKNVQEIETRFEELVRAMPKDGLLLYWAGAPALERVAKVSSAPMESYGENGMWHPEHIQFSAAGIAFDLYRHDTYHGHYQVPLYGRHNVDNAIAAVVVALREGMDPHLIQQGCETFLGATRRFTNVSVPGSEVRVIDDYAHHPTEVAATIAAANMHFGPHVVAVLQPHTYSRTRELLQEYRTALATADTAFVTEIDAAREAHLVDTISGSALVGDHPEKIHFEPDRERLLERVEAIVEPGDTVLCMTVGGYRNFAEELAQRVKMQ